MRTPISLFVALKKRIFAVPSASPENKAPGPDGPTQAAHSLIRAADGPNRAAHGPTQAARGPIHTAGGPTQVTGCPSPNRPAPRRSRPRPAPSLNTPARRGGPRVAVAALLALMLLLPPPFTAYEPGSRSQPASAAVVPAPAGMMTFDLNYDDGKWTFVGFSDTEGEVLPGQVSVGAPFDGMPGYRTINLTYPSQVTLNCDLPEGWQKIEYPGEETTTFQIVIDTPATQGKPSQLEAFFNSPNTYFTLLDPRKYPNPESDACYCTAMLSAVLLTKWNDPGGYLHYYQYVDKNLSWLQAYNAARDTKLTGTSNIYGYLATITSLEEQQFIYDNIAKFPGWLGGTRATLVAGGGVKISNQPVISTNLDDYYYGGGNSYAKKWYWADGAAGDPAVGLRSEIGMEFFRTPTWEGATTTSAVNAGTTPDAFNFFANAESYNKYSKLPGLKNIMSNSHEPNADSNVEAFLQFAFNSYATWNDLPNSGGSFIKGYYIEWGGAPYREYGGGGGGASMNPTFEVKKKFPVPYNVQYEVQNPDYEANSGPAIAATVDYAVRPPYLGNNVFYPQYGNKKFLYWSTSPNGSEYHFLDSIPSNKLTANMTLYGRWRNVYTVSFEPRNDDLIRLMGEFPDQYVDDGSYAISPPGLATGDFYPFYGDMEFLGWYMSEDDGNGNVSDPNPFEFANTKITDAVTDSDGKLTLYGRWRPHWRVTFDPLNTDYSGNPILPQIVTDGALAVEPSELEKGDIYPAYGNKQFLGWFDKNTTSHEYNFAAPVTADVDLVGKWKECYIVSFANTRNLSDVEPQPVLAGGYAQRPPAFDDEPFHFYDWSADPEAAPSPDPTEIDKTSPPRGIVSGSPFDFDATPINADTVIYGVWSPETYSVVYDPNGGHWDNDPNDIAPMRREFSDVSVGGAGYEFNTEDLPPTPERIGYDFAGWNSSLPPVGDPISENHTYHANWNPIDYTITYDLNDGDTGSASHGANHPPKYNLPQTYASPIEISDPTRKGYLFRGWTGYSAGGKLNIPNPLTSLVIPRGTTGDVYLTANWQQCEYSITYELLGGTNGHINDDILGALNPSSYAYEDTPIRFGNPTRRGYRFLGWTAEGAETFTDERRDYELPQDATGALRLIAHWEEAPYSIIYDMGGAPEGSNPPSNTTSYSIHSDFPIAITNPPQGSYPGHIFTGWTADGDEIDIPTQRLGLSIPQGTEGDITLTAHWNSLKYNIYYRLEDGVNDPSNPGSYLSETLPISFSPPTRAAYDFEGWTAEGALERDEVSKSFTLPAGSLGDLWLTASWSAVNYPIDYDLTGGRNAPDNPTSYSALTAFPLTVADPKRSGYRFMGWEASGPAFLEELTATPNYATNLSIDGIATYEMAPILLTAHWHSTYIPSPGGGTGGGGGSGGIGGGGGPDGGLNVGGGTGGGDGAGGGPNGGADGGPNGGAGGGPNGGADGGIGGGADGGFGDGAGGSLGGGADGGLGGGALGVGPIIKNATPGALGTGAGIHIAYITGYPDGSVRPDGALTRAEAAMMFWRLIMGGALPVPKGAAPTGATPEATAFPDVAEGSWYAQAVNYLAAADVLTGYPDGAFRPDGHISRAELAALVERAAAPMSAATGPAVAFSDLTESHWGYSYIIRAASDGLLDGYPDGTIRPNSDISRAETAKLLNGRLYRRLFAPDFASLHPSPYTDLPTAHWGYNDVMEASIRHACRYEEYEIWSATAGRPMPR